MLYSELKRKEVINTRDCRRLGRVIDVEFDECQGCICKIFVACHGKYTNLFGFEPELVICYNEIKKIGPDIIFVDIC
ncbi:MAG: YlmC/YmxH family sporulation protein [Eubacteriales bacterium]